MNTITVEHRNAVVPNFPKSSEFSKLDLLYAQTSDSSEFKMRIVHHRQKDTNVNQAVSIM